MQTTANFVLSLLNIYNVDFNGGLTTESVRYRVLVWGCSEFFLLIIIGLNYLPPRACTLLLHRLSYRPHCPFVGKHSVADYISCRCPFRSFLRFVLLSDAWVFKGAMALMFLDFLLCLVSIVSPCFTVLRQTP